MNENKNTKTYESQFTQYHQVTQLPPSTDTNDNKIFLDYTVDEITATFNEVNNDPKDVLNFIVHNIFAQVDNVDDPSIYEQMSTKKGINKLGQKYIDDLLKEFTQFADLNVLKTINPRLLTTKQKRKNYGQSAW